MIRAIFLVILTKIIEREHTQMTISLICCRTCRFNTLEKKIQLSRNRFVLPLIFIVILSLSQGRQDNVSAESSFTIQEIEDLPIDWLNLRTKQYDSTLEERSTDILAVNYYTNRDFLNATVWLYYPFQVKPNYTMVNYGMLIDSDFDNRTGFDGIDHKFEIRWDNNSRVWTSTLEGWSPNGENRIIHFKNNYTGFFESDKHYVTLSLNLDDIGSPPKYKVIFYAEVERDRVSFTDFTRWVAIPPLQVVITTIPNSIELHKGEERTIEVKLNSSQGYEPTVKIDAKSRVDKIDFEFPLNDTLNIPTFGEATTPLTIRASDDASVGPYTLFISANSTFPSEQLIDVGSENDENSTIPLPAEYIVTQSSVLVTIQEPLTWVDQVSDFWNKVGNSISFIYGILAGISPWIYTRLRRRIKNDKQKNNRESDNAT
jgi:hypothetical protein